MFLYVSPAGGGRRRRLVYFSLSTWTSRRGPPWSGPAAGAGRSRQPASAPPRAGGPWGFMGWLAPGWLAPGMQPRGGAPAPGLSCWGPWSCSACGPSHGRACGARGRGGGKAQQSPCSTSESERPAGERLPARLAGGRRPQAGGRAQVRGEGRRPRRSASRAVGGRRAPPAAAAPSWECAPPRRPRAWDLPPRRASEERAGRRCALLRAP